MAELHKFQDDCKAKEDGVKPIKSRELDENFTTVRLKLGTAVEAVFEIQEAPGARDELILASSAPTSGTWILGIENGTLTWLETEECE